MDYPWSGSRFPPENHASSTLFPFPAHEHPTTIQSIPAAEFPPWISTAYDQGEYITTSAVHIVPYQSEIPDSQMVMLPNLYTNNTVARSHQLLPSNNTSAANVQTMAPPPNRRKRKAPTLRSNDWQPVKARVIELHIAQKEPLPKVKRIIEEEFKLSGFSAT
jgi:hypothetical protein